MADYREYRESEEPPSALAEAIEGAVRRISTAIAIAGALIALGIYSHPGPPKYQAFATERGVVRVNTRNGSLVECIDGRCGILQRESRGLDHDSPAKGAPALSQPAAGTTPQAAPALPAPQQPAPQQASPKQTAPQQPEPAR